MPTLNDFVNVSLGQKTLLNDFFHVDAERIERFGVEPEFLRPLYLLSDLNSGAYFQTQATRTHVFQCTALPADLRGTGAGKYVRWGANQTIGGKKQSGSTHVKWPDTDNMKKKQHWYWPSDSLKEGRIALRKGVNEVYAPFLFEEPVAFDQRLYVVTSRSIDVDLMSAYLSSSVFALALEVSADMGLGGGVLSLGTRALRALPCGDLSKLQEPDHKDKVLAAARALHSADPPSASSYPMHPALRTLDEAVLATLGLESARAEELEQEVATLAASRRAIRELRTKTVAETADVNVATVAQGVASRVRTWLEPRGWPDSGSRAPGQVLNFPAGKLTVVVSTILGQCFLSVADGHDRVVMSEEFAEPIAELIVRALMLGRRAISAPLTDEEAIRKLDELEEIVRGLEAELDSAMEATGVGFRFEGEVKRRALDAVSVDLRGLRRPFFSGTWEVNS